MVDDVAELMKRAPESGGNLSLRAALIEACAAYYAPGDQILISIDRAIAALAQPAGRSGGEWRPISEAPMDGTRILAFNEAAGIYSTAFTTRWTGEPYERGYEGFPCGFWSTGLGSYPFGRWDVQPTFWMPLPAPPTGEPG